jgi:hypothetical protein
MPSSSEILATLARIAHDALPFAVLWHVALAGSLVAVLLGWRPSARLCGVLSIAPLISVSALAFIFGNVFNGAVFALLAAGLALVVWKLPPEPMPFVPSWSMQLGIVMVAFGWVYPHFLRDSTWVTFFIAAPLGVLPCPTLSLLTGLALLGLRPPGRAWPWALAVAGLFYGLFGAVLLGVTLDATLFLGAAGLAVEQLLGPRGRELIAPHDGLPN